MKINDHDRTQPPAATLGVAQRVIAAHGDHGSALRTVQTLTEGGLPGERVVVVGRGLTFVERGTGWLSTAEVTGRGALSGLVTGGLTGWLLAVFDLLTASVSTWWLAVNAAILGAALGAIIALIGYAGTRGQRSFSTAPTLTASHFDVLVDADLADQAARTLAAAQPAPPHD
jgi:hypothetical protein